MPRRKRGSAESEVTFLPPPWEEKKKGGRNKRPPAGPIF